MQITRNFVDRLDYVKPINYTSHGEFYVNLDSIRDSPADAGNICIEIFIFYYNSKRPRACVYK